MKEAFPLEYNSQRANLVIPEYGRHVQKLIRHCRAIKDKEEQQVYVERIVDLMHQMNPQSKNVAEYREKLWRHVYRIAEYDLVAVPPSGNIPKLEDLKSKPKPLAYPQSEFRFRHYGHNIQKLVNKAVSMEDGHKKDALVQVIGGYMKLANKTWNKDNYVNDEIIKSDLVLLSKGKLTISESFSLEAYRISSGKNQRHKGKGRSGGGKNSNNRYKKGSQRKK